MYLETCSYLTYNGKVIERAEKLKYPGTWLYEEWPTDKEIDCRIEQARGARMLWQML